MNTDKKSLELRSAQDYFNLHVELKGQDIKHAVAQVLAGERLCCDSLGGYKSHYRIVPKKSRTLDIKSKEYRNLYDKVGPKRLRCETGRLEDILD